METYLIEIGQNGRLDLIKDIAQPDMIDEANKAFGGPLGRDGLIVHVKTFRRQIGALKLDIKQIVGNENEANENEARKLTHILLYPFYGF